MLVACTLTLFSGLIRFLATANFIVGSDENAQHASFWACLVAQMLTGCAGPMVVSLPTAVRMIHSTFNCEGVGSALRLPVANVGQPAMVPRVAGGNGHGHSGDGNFRGHRVGLRRYATLRLRRRRHPEDGLGLVRANGLRLRFHLRRLPLQRIASALAP